MRGGVVEPLTREELEELHGEITTYIVELNIRLTKISERRKVEFYDIEISIITDPEIKILKSITTESIDTLPLSELKLLQKLALKTYIQTIINTFQNKYDLLKYLNETLYLQPNFLKYVSTLIFDPESKKYIKIYVSIFTEEELIYMYREISTLIRQSTILTVLNESDDIQSILKEIQTIRENILPNRYQALLRWYKHIYSTNKNISDTDLKHLNILEVFNYIKTRIIKKPVKHLLSYLEKLTNIDTFKEGIQQIEPYLTKKIKYPSHISDFDEAKMLLRDN